MSIIIPISRTCTEISSGNADQYPSKASRPLEDFRDTAAYVLLGDPGAGKTTAFEAECEALEEQICPITARDFLTFDPQNHPEWLGKTLFIDGLDEVRAGVSDAHTPFDAIRGRLDALGRPRFRLSCREADWLGANDRKHLEAVSPDAEVTVLRLDPLTDPNIEKLLEAHPDVDDAEAFITEASKRGIGDLLRNPQTLDLLAKAVAGGDWPESRQETFEMACSEMVREPNKKHQTASASSSLPTPAQLLDAAGHLCTVHLIVGKAGYTLHGEPDDEYPALDQCEYAHPERLRLVLGSRMLFKGVGPSDNRFTPVHRHVAEFLGARYLARIIHHGLPARRVIALMTGEDGTVVTELRGLSAWLAAHCQEARADLIKRDPIGVGLYGDVRGFRADEKRALLDALRDLASKLPSTQRAAVAYGALVTPDMEPVFRAVLTDSSREREHQSIADFVLRILTKGERLPRLSELLLDITRDDTWRSRVAALDAFIHNCPDNQDKTSKLKGLLADIQAGSPADTDNELLGTLLARLYPHDLPPSEVWDYLSEQGYPELLGRHRRFWDMSLMEQSSDEQVTELLDNLKERLSGLQSALNVRHLNGLPLKLLARGLEVHGDLIKPERLYDWLSVGSSWDGDSQTSWYGAKSIRQIRAWMEQHPEVQKAVIMEGLDRSSDSDEFRLHVRSVHKCLYGANLPSDFGRWCLEQAVAKADTKPRVSEYLFEEAFSRRGTEGLSLDTLREHARGNKGLQATLDRLLASQMRRADQILRYWNQEGTLTKERQQKEEKWLAHVRSNESALYENRAAPVLLFQLARSYFGIDSTSDGPKAVEEALQGDRRLTQAVLQSFRGAVERVDVPAFEEILNVQAQGRMHYLALPFLAGLAEIEKTALEDASQWDDDRIRKAIAFYYGYGAPPFLDHQPEWYRQLLAARPEFVAEVQVQIAVSEFRSGREHISQLWELAHDKAHAQVAKHVTLPLLRAFPTRCKLKQLRALDHLLWAAIQHADRTSLWELIEKKRSRMSMNHAQRVHWLAAGFAIAPDVYQADLIDFTYGHEQRIRYLAEFFREEHVPLSWFDTLGIAGLARFIRLVGGYVGPELMNEQGRLTPVMEAARLVHEVIQRLAASPDKDASEALASLLKDPALSAWRDVLSHAQDTQQVIRRDADYRHPTVEQVCQTLKGGTPANPGDLAALVMDRLGELAVQIRKGNTDDWRQYWEGLRGQSPAPKHEDDCRDALLSDLQQRLPQGVDAQPEGHYANDKRADIRVSYGGFQVPVEVKKNTHRDLWRAVRDQLMAKYASDPETDGYGIYLVFWFGKKYTQPSPSGKRPANAEELKERLEKTLSADERRKISVCVIDVSKP